MVYVVIALWIILGLGVFFVAIRRGPRGAARQEGGEALSESRWGQRLFTLAVMLVAAFGLAIPALVVADNSAHKASEAIGGVHLNAQDVKGRELFARSCVFCHTLAAVKSYGRVGPNLDIHIGDEISSPSGRKALVLSAILEGRARGKGDMPALLYQGREAEDVADFVAAVAGH